MDVKAIMDMANQLRGQLTDAQEQAGNARYTGEAGGGMVRIVINGRHQVLEIKIDPVAAQDVPLLEDMIRAAFGQASSQLASGLQDKLGAMAQGFGLDLSSVIPGAAGTDSGEGGDDGGTDGSDSGTP